MRLALYTGLWPSAMLAGSLRKWDHPVLYLNLHVYAFRASYLRLGSLSGDLSLDGTVINSLQLFI